MTVTLPSDDQAFVDRLVVSRADAPAEQVVRASLAAVADREDELDDWLREKVAPTYDAMVADPSQAIPIEQVEANLRAHHAARQRAAE